ncbi:MAG: TolC family protein, partial [Rhodothermales bacterium]|nr:TolC family protein [Rhodothermales bacterium]
MSHRRILLLAAVVAVVTLVVPAHATAQSGTTQSDIDQSDMGQSDVDQSGLTESGPSEPLQDAPVVMTLDEAIQIALVQNRSILSARLEIDRAGHQVREGWAELLPQVDLNSQYTRNVRSPNPFAGSEAGGFFSTLGFIDWLSYNEQARTDSDPVSVPITLEEFFDRQAAGREQAGIQLSSGDNPFSVPNVYRSGLSVSQAIFDGRAVFGALGASKWLVPMNRNAVDRQEQLLVQQVKEAWYG